MSKYWLLGGKKYGYKSNAKKSKKFIYFRNFNNICNYGNYSCCFITTNKENAGSRKAETEKFITKFCRYYTPAVVFSALALAIIPPFIFADTDFSTWIYRALSFLVVSCPCALVVSVPLGLFAGIGAASKKGVLVKGGNYLEALKDVDMVDLVKNMLIEY